MRFPLATAGQVRREVARQLGTVPHARWWFLLAVVLLGVGSYATVLVPQLMGQIVDLVTGDGAAEPMWRIGSELIVLSVAGAAMSAAGFYLVARLSERVIANLRQDMVGTALGLPTHQVEDAGTGDLVSRSTDDVAELSAAVTETLPTLSTSLFSIVATVIALLALDWYFLLIPVVVAPVYYVAARMYLARAPQRYAAERAAMAERARRVLEAIRGRATVRAFSMEDRMHTEIENASWSVVRKGITARTTMLVLNTWMLGIEFLMLTMALSVGYYLVSTDVLTVGAVTGAVLMIIRLRGPMNTLMRVLDVVQSGYASLARIVGVVSDPPVPVPDSGADAPRGRVELRECQLQLRRRLGRPQRRPHHQPGRDRRHRRGFRRRKDHRGSVVGRSAGARRGRGARRRVSGVPALRQRTHRPARHGQSGGARLLRNPAPGHDAGQA